MSRRWHTCSRAEKFSAGEPPHDAGFQPKRRPGGDEASSPAGPACPRARSTAPTVATSCHLCVQRSAALSMTLTATTRRCSVSWARDSLSRPRTRARARVAVNRAFTVQLLYTPAMSVLETHLDAAAPEFVENAAHMDGLVAELERRLARARAGGGEEAVRRHREQGKLPRPRPHREAARPGHALPGDRRPRRRRPLRRGGPVARAS